jgi:hypothetical protein
MHPIKLFKIFLSLFMWNVLAWWVLNFSENQGVTLSYTTNGALGWERRFVVVGGGIPDSSWFPSAEVEGARDGSWRRRSFAQIYLAAKPSNVGVNVDGLAYPLHHPTVCGHQMRVQSFLSGAALDHHAVVGSGAFPGGAKPLNLDIWCSVDHLGTCVTESHMEKLAFTRVCLSYVRVIMVIMRVSLVESLCHTMMWRIPTLEYVLSGERAFLWPHLIVSSN